ncbi:hypothetical protein PINS_up006458 [Pythium insidiosum]|nr:hypothetical protein PINS_up006458 [Pythium insidiosum]
MLSFVSKRLRGLRPVVVRVWVAAQVELHGRYSLQNFQDLDDYYRRTPWWRAVIVCLLTPLPAIVIVLLIDLLPLDPISYGPDNPRLWGRAIVTTTLIAVAILEQFRQHVTELRLTRRSIWIMSLLPPVVATSVTYAITMRVWFPMPFTMALGSIPFLMTLVALLLVSHHQQLRTNRRLVRDLKSFLVTFGSELLMTFAYPVYCFLYSRLNSIEQTLSILLLPIMKIVNRNIVAQWLPDSDDARPEAVVFNVEIFHALFVAFTMQKTTSLLTILALMAVDCVHAWLTFVDITIILRHVWTITAQLERTLSTTSPSRQASPHHDLRWLLQIATRVATEHPELVAQRTKRGLTSPSTPSSQKSNQRIFFATVVPMSGSASIEPTKPAESSNLDVLGVDEKRTLVQAILKVLYISEFLALIEYTEVIMPMIFSTCPHKHGVFICLFL